MSFFFRFCVAFVATVTAVISVEAAPAPLFDGKSFAGWEGDTKGTWRIVDGAFEAGSLERKQEHNDFLATVKEYENFDLTLKWKLEGTEGFVNGGVQFRSKRVPNHEMSGYQADLGAGYDGCLYDESRRNAVLARPDAAVQKQAMKPTGEWNLYRIRAEGPRIQMWLNGVQTVDFTESAAGMARSGIIAVQIHSDAKSIVRYKVIAIEELPSSPPPAVKAPEVPPAMGKGVPLFDGRLMDGWTGTAVKFWHVENGELIGGGEAQSADSWLAGTREFENFDLRFRAKTVGPVGTGVFFRSDVAQGRRITGWQLDIGQGYDGGLYKEGQGGGMIAYPSKEKVGGVVKPGEWNDYRLRAEGRHLRTWVNGVLMAEHTERGRSAIRGVLALEISSGGGGQAHFKDMEIEELPPSPAEAELATGPASRMKDTLKPRPKLAPFTDEIFALNSGDVVVFTGSENTVMEQGTGGLESLLALRWKDAAPHFRHMGWEGDTVFRQNRMMEWGSWPVNLEGADATVVVAWFGQVEALDGQRTVEEFTTAYGNLLGDFAKATPRIVVIGPPPFEKPIDARVPDNCALNERVAKFNEAARTLAAQQGLVFVDLFAALKDNQSPLTRDGMHFTEEGSKAVGRIIARTLGADGTIPESLRAAIVEKNRLWFDTWRCMNWAFAFGDRNTQPFAGGGGDRPPFVDELRKYQPQLSHADAVVHALAAGKAAPPPLDPAPPRADPPALSPKEEMANFKMRDGFAVDLFADESLGVVRPIQIRWDERGRLWVACTPAYPQLQPGEHGNDYIVILEDTDGDGHADQSTRFAEHLTMPMGFEFATQDVGGGLYVVESTKLVHLPDRDYDDHADGRTIVLSGFGTGDTHQDANSLRWGPDGCLWFTQGYHIWSYVETPHGLAELNRSGVWRFNPRTLRLNSFLNESSAGLNCWGTAWDDFGQIFHGSGADTAIWFTTPALVPTLHPLGLPTAMAQSRGKSMEPEFLGSGHLPADLRGVLLKSTYYTSQIQLYRLRDAGSGFASEEMGDLMSGGNEFRPVETRVGPDGALYVCDWLNPVIGHYQASYRDPRRDRSHGRIWRVSAKGAPLVTKPALSGKSASELVAHLESPERWERDAAKFALYRKPAAEVLDATENLDVATASPRLLYELSGVFAAHESPRADVIDRLLASDDFRWRAWGVHLIGVWADRLSDPLPRLQKAIADEHPRVRLEAVVACSWMPPQFAAEAVKIATLAMEKPLDPPLDYALTQCIHALAPQWQAALAKGHLDFGTRFQALGKLLSTVGDKNATAQVRELLKAKDLAPTARDSLLGVLIEFGTPDDASVAVNMAADSQAVMDALVAVAGRHPDRSYDSVLVQLFDSPYPAAQIAACRIISQSGKDWGASGRVGKLLADPQAASPVRAAAMAATGALTGKSALPELLAFVASPDVVLRNGALAAAAPLDPEAVAKHVARLLPEAADTSAVGGLLYPLLSQKDGATILAESIAGAKLSAQTARLALQWMAQSGRDDAPLRIALNVVAGITENGPAYSEALVEKLTSGALAKGDAHAGKAVFHTAQSACLACHKIGQDGGTIGPDLSTIGLAMTREAIVESIFWPKRQVKEGYLLTQITTNDGRTLQGYAAGETKETLTLRDFAANSLQQISKLTIATRSDVGTLMPEGLLAAMSEQQQFDLLHYLFELGK